MIILVKSGRNKKKPLGIEKVDKTAIAEVAKKLSIINLDNKYSWIINNSDMNAAKDLGLTSIKKY